MNLQDSISAVREVIAQTENRELADLLGDIVSVYVESGQYQYDEDEEEE